VIDLLIFLTNYGCIAPGCQGDLTGDGQVNSADLLEFLVEFSTTCP
jgi:hypothetical protein